MQVQVRSPPHGGCAFGLDAGDAYGRRRNHSCDCFSKNNAGKDLMMEAPSPVDDAQLKISFTWTLFQLKIKVLLIPARMFVTLAFAEMKYNALLFFLFWSGSVWALTTTNIIFITIDDLNDYVEGFDGHPQTRNPQHFQNCRSWNFFPEHMPVLRSVDRAD